VVPDGSGGGIPGNGGCTGLAFAFFPCHLAIQRHGRSLAQSPRRRHFRAVSRRALPRGAGRARRRVLHPRRVERCAPATLIVLSQLQIIALTVYPHGDVPNPGPRVQPGAKGMERAVVRGHGAPGEADSSTQEPSALVEHALLDDAIGSNQ
jgi:hypothetical protein